MWQPYVGLVGYWQAMEELKLTPDQVDRIKKIGTDFEDEMRTALRDNKLTGGERRKWFAELSRRLEARTLKDAKTVLTEVQAVRLRQIEIWDAGPLVFTDADIVKDLNLTEQQVGVLTTIRNEYLNKLRDPRSDPSRGKPGGGPSDEDITKAKDFRDGLSRASLAECLEVLTDDQKTRFNVMKGAKFELDLIRKAHP
jgi:hypothetical protein